MSVGRRRRIVHVEPATVGEWMPLKEWITHYIADHEARHQRNADEAQRVVATAVAGAQERDAQIHTACTREHAVIAERLRVYVTDHEARHTHDEIARREAGAIILEQHFKDHTSHDRIHDVERTARDRDDTAMSHRLEGMNEIRAQLSIQAQSFVTKDAAAAQNQATAESAAASRDTLRARIEALERLAERSQGRGAGLNAGWGYLVAGIGLVIVIVNFVFYLLSR